MKLKTLAIAVAVLAVLSAAAFWANRAPSPAGADPRVGNPLADSAVVAKAAQLRLSGGGRTVLLAKQADGSWQVPGYFGLPADFSKLSGFVGDLASAKITRLVTVNPGRIARLGFDDNKVEILDGTGGVLWAAGIGKAADAGGRFVRFGEESRAYLASLNDSIESDPKAWADTTLLSLKADDIGSIQIPFADGGPLTLSRKAKDAPWTADRMPAGQRVSADKVSTLLGSLGGLRFSDTGDPKDPQAAAARQRARVIAVTTFDGTAYSIALGRKPDEKKPAIPTDKSVPPAEAAPAGPVYAFISSSEAKAPVNGWMQKRSFQVDEYILTGLPQKPDDLFEAAPAAAPTDKPKP